METKNLLNKKITQWLLLVAMLVGCSASALASNIYITAPGGTKINVYTWNGCNQDGSGSWPGKTVVNSATAYDQGGFYSFTSCSGVSSYSYIINNSSQQTGNLSLSEDTWGYYNNNTSFSVLMKNSTLSSVSCQFASSSISGWGTKVTATWDSSKNKFKYTCTNWGGSSGIDVYLGGTKFLYKPCTQSAGNYIIYWDPYTGNFTFEDACTPPSISTHPSTTDANYCQGATATALSVTASGTELSYQWQKCSTQSGIYTDISGATNSSYTPVTTTAGTTYYKCKVTNDCGSATSNASGAIKVNAAPTITSSTGGTRCGTGTVTLSATASAGDVKWYAASTGGTSLDTGTSFTTPSIAATKTYYAEADDNGCVSTSRTAVVATVITRPAAPVSGGDISVCYGSDAEFEATQANSRCIDWYTASTGGEKLETCQTTYTKTNLTSDYTIYAEARIADNGCISASRTAIKATVKALNNVSNITFYPASIKKGETTQATATVTTVGGTGAWSTSTPSLISFSSTSDNPTTINANGIGTAKVTYTLTGGCSGTNSKTVDLVINSDCDAPNAGTISGTTAICAGGSVSLSVTGYTSTNTTLQWNKNGSPVAGKTSNTYTESNVTENATYTVTVTRTDVDNCSATTPTGYEVTVTQIPSITTHTDNSRCGTGTVTLGATASAGTINWYAAQTGGTSLGTGTSFTTPSISTNTTYYVSATQNGCTTASRTAVTATVKAVPSISSIAASTEDSGCGAGTVKFTASGVSASSTVHWYENSTKKGEGNPYNYNDVAAGSSVTLKAKAVHTNGCESEFTTTTTGTRKALPSLTTAPVGSAVTAYLWEPVNLTATTTDGTATVAISTASTKYEVVDIPNGKSLKAGNNGDIFSVTYTATGSNGCQTQEIKTVTAAKATEDCSK